MARQYTLRAIDENGNEVIVRMGLTVDRKIAVRRSNAGTIFLTPEAASRAVDHIRDLQAQALQGQTWRID